jgi:hypothetical protein
MKEYCIWVRFEKTQDNAQIITNLQLHFCNVIIVCEDCLKILQYMREAYRGVLITRNNIKMGRAPIITVEEARNRIGQPVIEIILTYEKIPINVQLYGEAIRFKTISDSPEWAEKLRHLLPKVFPNTNIEFSIFDAKYEVLGFFADLEKRFNEGDILEGESKTDKRSIGDFVKQFPQYAHFIK